MFWRLKLNLVTTYFSKAVNPSITGSVPAPKRSMNWNPSIGRARVRQYVNEKYVSPQGSSPLSIPIVNKANADFFFRKDEKTFFNAVENLTKAVETNGIFSPPIPDNPIRIKQTAIHRVRAN
jgi:hypothetical protein